MTLLFITISSSTLASDGEYRCDSVQNVSYQDLSNRILDISYHTDKVIELKKNGLRSAALDVIKEGHFAIEQTSKKYIDEKFCYSLSTRAKYQISLLEKYKVELDELEIELKEATDCSFAIMMLEEEISRINSKSEFYEQFIAKSKSITKAGLIRKDKSCDSSQQEQINKMISAQNIQLTLLNSGLSKS